MKDGGFSFYSVKRPLILGSILLVVLAVILSVTRPPGVDGGPQSSPASPLPHVSASSPSREASSRSRSSLSSQGLPLVHIVADSYAPDPADPVSTTEPLFTTSGDPTVYTIVDRQGKALLKSGGGLRIEWINVAPDNRHIFVKSIYSSFILNPSTGEKIQLPSEPPAPGLMTLRGWLWIGDNTLVAMSGIPHPNWSGCSPPLDETFFYTYSIDTLQLSAVALPPSLQESDLRAVATSDDGHVHLKIELGGENGDETDLGWFKLQAP